MKNLHIHFPISRFKNTIHHTNRTLLIGSCFSTEMAKWFNYHYLSHTLNPFGTLYDPISIANNMIASCQQKDHSCNIDPYITNWQGIWYLWNMHGDISSPEKETLCQLALQQLSITYEAILQSSWVMITYGTSLVRYYQGMPVANCHKHPIADFTSIHMDVDEIVQHFSEMYTAVKELNPKIHFVLSVSPVRHIKSGIVENTSSKARLHLAIEKIVRMYEGVYYFPAFEIMMDELRDYRFYATDRIHPTTESCTYIWQRFCETAMQEDIQIFMKEIDPIRKAEGHIFQHPNTPSAQDFFRFYEGETKKLQKKYPHLDFSSTIHYFQRQIIN